MVNEFSKGCERREEQNLPGEEQRLKLRIQSHWLEASKVRRNFSNFRRIDSGKS